MAPTTMGGEQWPMSDELLAQDRIAEAKVEHPFDPPNLSDAGIILPDDFTPEADEAAAAVVLGELGADNGEDADGETGEVDDDDEIDADDDDDAPVEEV